MPPQQPAQYPQTPQSAAVAPSIKVRKNPFYHLGHGVKQLFKMNAVPVVVISALWAVLTLGAVMIAGVGGLLLFTTLFFGATASEIIRTVGIVLVVYLVFIIVSSFLQLAMSRTSVSSVRGIRESVGSVFTFSKGRYITAIKTNLAILGILVGGMIGMIVINTVLSMADNLIVILFQIIFSIAAFVIFIVFALRMIYVQFLLAEDNKPPSISATMSRSKKLFQNSAWAVLLYGLLIIVLSIIWSILFNSVGGEPKPAPLPSSSIDYSPAMGAAVGAGIGAVIIGVTIGNIINAMFFAGLANIYHETRDVLGVNGPAAPQQPGPGAGGHPQYDQQPAAVQDYPQEQPQEQPQPHLSQHQQDQAFQPHQEHQGHQSHHGHHDSQTPQDPQHPQNPPSYPPQS